MLQVGTWISSHLIALFRPSAHDLLEKLCTSRDFGMLLIEPSLDAGTNTDLLWLGHRLSERLENRASVRPPLSKRKQMTIIFYSIKLRTKAYFDINRRSKEILNNKQSLNTIECQPTHPT